MYTYRTTRNFENGLRHCLKDLNKDVQVLKDALELLTEKGCLPDSYNHNKRLTLLLTNTGTHDELFKKK